VKENSSKKQRPFNLSYYTGIAAKMIGIIVAGTLAGHYLDKYIAYKIPVFTLVLSILSVFIAMYVVIREFSA
jgi:F0F1-type ATP synthase assembly protein I